MTCLVDTDVLVAWVSKREDRHAQARALLDEALRGAWGAPFVTDYVVDEALTFLMARQAPIETAERVLALTLGHPVPGLAPAFPTVRVSDEAFRHSVPLFRRHYKRGLSFTDCTSLAIMAEREAQTILSFDRGFDGLVARASA